jgi:hypothetical protein
VKKRNVGDSEANPEKRRQSDQKNGDSTWLTLVNHRSTSTTKPSKCRASGLEGKSRRILTKN